MILIIVQYFSAAISLIYLKVFTRLTIKGLENLNDLNRPFIVAANHESHLDPQLIGITLLHRPRLFPLRYMTKNEFFNIPVFNLFLWLLGAFKAHKKHGIGKSLLTPIKILEKRGAVIMFPEGRIIKPRPQLGEGRRGTAILALTTKSAIVPMSLHTPPNLAPWRFFTTRPTVIINVGEPFYLNNVEYPDFSDENTYKATKVVMKKIADLYFQYDYGIKEKRQGERRGS